MPYAVFDATTDCDRLSQLHNQLRLNLCLDGTWSHLVAQNVHFYGNSRISHSTNELECDIIPEISLDDGDYGHRLKRRHSSRTDGYMLRHAQPSPSTLEWLKSQFATAKRSSKET